MKSAEKAHAHFVLLCFKDIAVFTNWRFVATLCGASLSIPLTAFAHFGSCFTSSKKEWKTQRNQVRGRWEGGLGWGIHVIPWLIHVNVWQNPLQYCKVISLQLIKINEKKRVDTCIYITDSLCSVAETNTIL